MARYLVSMQSLKPGCAMYIYLEVTLVWGPALFVLQHVRKPLVSALIHKLPIIIGDHRILLKSPVFKTLGSSLMV